MIKTVRKWRARRVGGRITVTGEDAVTRLDTKITNIDSILPPPHASDGFVYAVDHAGNQHKLLLY